MSFIFGKGERHKQERRWLVVGNGVSQGLRLQVLCCCCHCCRDDVQSCREDETMNLQMRRTAGSRYRRDGQRGEE